MSKALPHMFATLHIRLTGYKMKKFEQYLYERNGCVDHSGLIGAYKLISFRRITDGSINKSKEEETV